MKKYNNFIAIPVLAVLLFLASCVTNENDFFECKCIISDTALNASIVVTDEYHNITQAEAEENCANNADTIWAEYPTASAVVCGLVED